MAHNCVNTTLIMSVSYYHLPVNQLGSIIITLVGSSPHSLPCSVLEVARKEEIKIQGRLNAFCFCMFVSVERITQRGIEKLNSRRPIFIYE